ncbi:MAG: Rieske Fe-S protein [Acidimicrobiales bacterium]|nr:Rieske Fe-S protein [Acidimicrobiales bacterium]
MTVAIVVIVVVLLAAVLLFANARRRDRDAAIGSLSRETRDRDRGEASIEQVLGDTDAEKVATGREVERAAALERRRVVVPATVSAPKPPAVPVDDETYGVSRRQFLNRGIVTMMSVSLGGFGLSMLAFLWPSLSGGFGTKIRAGKVDDILNQIADKREPFYVAEGRFYINPYPKDSVPKAKQVGAYSALLPGYEAGVVALYQKCVHLGCRVPWCKTSQWFECPCHGSQYNRVGEKKGGPAPRGLDRFIVSIDNGTVVVDTSPSGLIVGPPIGTNTTGQEAEGPHCIGRAE